ncbi:MAG TPA: pyridoxamine 5'-phosphate oxidase family protein [Nitrospira sp.]|mgnify:CR=1 FL=1|nr:pyridoxamine 5'-phosphate oxidase family protein [Nitrospira sp.]
MQVFNEINNEHASFMREQKIFFTGTAGKVSRVNISPKAMDTFRILSPNLVGYLDHTGSGNETAAHLLEDRRITVMFCSFDKRSLILRVFGQGRSIYPSDDNWRNYILHFEQALGQRKIVLISVDRVQTSCGFAVPIYEFIEGRDVLCRWAEMKGTEGLKTYRTQKNQISIDGLPTGHTE